MQKQMITIGFHDKESPRYRNVCKEFIKEGYEIIECHTNAKGLFRKYKDLENQYKKLKARSNKPEASAILVTFPGFIIMPLAWFLTRLRPAGFAGQARPKLIFDAFVSISDTLVSDRGKFSWINPFAWFLYCTDVILCRMADEILIDTEAHKKFFVRRFFLSPKRIRVLHVGTREDLFHPGPKEDRLQKGKFNVLFVGSFIPLQGIEYIVDAAEILKEHSDMHFTLLGSGQTRHAIEKRIAGKKLGNITLLPFRPLAELPHYLRSADIALGTFGTSGKANRVIAHKVFDAVACGVPVITAKNDAIGEKFTDGKEVFLCKAGSGTSLAEKILEVHKRIGPNGIREPIKPLSI